MILRGCKCPKWVYPRVGGATVVAGYDCESGVGLSPRGRGNRRYWCNGPNPGGSIPAWAGQPSRTISCATSIPVYPRVGGATEAEISRLFAQRGLSPRGAGQPSLSIIATRSTAVYPRVGGATSTTTMRTRSNPGLSPRGRGQPLRPPRSCQSNTVYPRVGGATLTRDVAAADQEGLSPRGRGNLPRARGGERRGRSIPAWAGQPTQQSVQYSPWRVYPRVGGATSFWRPVSHRWQGLSPRGRGNRMDMGGISASAGSIPAWAGQPPNQPLH